MQLVPFLTSIVRSSLKVGFRDLFSILQPNASNQKYLNFAEHYYYHHQKNRKNDLIVRARSLVMLYAIEMAMLLKYSANAYHFLDRQLLKGKNKKKPLSCVMNK